MKIKIKSHKSLFCGSFGNIFWTVTFNGKTTSYPNAEAAFQGATKRYKRFYKESAAFSMLKDLAHNMLEIKEYDFVTKLHRTKCAGITKSQYGYLKGIYERQQREW